MDNVIIDNYIYIYKISALKKMCKTYFEQLSAEEEICHWQRISECIIFVKKKFDIPRKNSGVTVEKKLDY